MWVGKRKIFPAFVCYNGQGLLGANPVLVGVLEDITEADASLREVVLVVPEIVDAGPVVPTPN
jgi:hypothetical protein